MVKTLKTHNVTDKNFSLELQLFIIRVYIGLDLVHHFAEKFGWLGNTAFQNVTHYFVSVGFSPKMVLVAGLCEFAGFIGFTFGLFTRVASVGLALYLIIALFAGDHENLGFTWANAGGGWEFPLFWAVLCLSFVINGGGRWSLDRVLVKKFPKQLQFLCR